MSNSRLLALAVLLAALVCEPALAQSAPSNVDDRLRRQVETQNQDDAVNAIMSGDTDLILLAPVQHFTLHGSLSGTETSNAALAPTGGVADTIGQLQLGLRAATRIGEQVDLWADAGLIAARYARNSELGYDALSGEVGVATELAGFAVSATYQPTVIYERDFGPRQLTQHTLGLAVSRRFRLGRLLLEPVVSAQRVEAHPAEYENWAGGANITMMLPFGREARFLVYATGGYQRRIYDDYFSGLVGADRKDNQWNAGLGLNYRASNRVSASLSYTFRQNHSTSDISAYRVHGGHLGLSGTVRF